LNKRKLATIAAEIRMIRNPRRHERLASALDLLSDVKIPRLVVGRSSSEASSASFLEPA
jgi:hypothetical protein